jgi:hypothetical protein
MSNPLVILLVVVALLLILASTLGIFWVYLFADTSTAPRDERRLGRVRQVTLGTLLLCLIAILVSYIYYLA